MVLSNDMRTEEDSVDGAHLHQGSSMLANGTIPVTGATIEQRLQQLGQTHVAKKVVPSLQVQETRAHVSLMKNNQSNTEVRLSEGEIQLCKQIFDRAANSPFITGQRFVENNSNLSSTHSGTLIDNNTFKAILSFTGVFTALHILGINISKNNLEELLAKHNTLLLQNGKRAQGVVVEEFLAIVRDIKCTILRKKRTDGDLMEAFTGLGGTEDLETGVPARSLHSFIQAIGLEFDEKAKITKDGDMINTVSYEEESCAGEERALLSLQNDVAPPPILAIPEEVEVPQGDSRHGYLKVFGYGHSRSLFKGVVFVVIAIIRLRRSRMPWFLDTARLQALPSASTEVNRIRVEFKPAAKWSGRKNGYYFTRGVLGLGYYLITAPLPSFHSAIAAKYETSQVHAEGKTYLNASPTPSSSSSGGEGEGEDYTEDGEPVPEIIAMLRKRKRRGKRLLQKALDGGWNDVKEDRLRLEKEKVIAQGLEATDSISVIESEGGESVASRDAMMCGPASPTASTAVQAAEASPVSQFRNIENCFKATRKLAEQQRVVIEDPKVAKVVSPRTRNIMIDGIKDIDAEEGQLRESGLFREERFRAASGPPKKTFAQTVSSALRDPAILALSLAPDSANNNDTTGALPTSDNNVGAAARTGFSSHSSCLLSVFKGVGTPGIDGGASPLFRIDKEEKEEAMTPWGGAKWGEAGWDLASRPNLKVENETVIYKKVSVMLRETVFSVLACMKADRVTAQWRRHVGLYGRRAPANILRDRMNDYAWQHWRALEDDNKERVDSECVSRTFSDRLRELDDQYITDEDEDYIPDPEVGKRLNIYAKEMGLRSNDFGEMENLEDNIIERISELSDIAAADRLICFEDFAGFFDRFRVYKSHKNVSTFQLPAGGIKKKEKAKALLAEASSLKSTFLRGLVDGLERTQQSDNHLFHPQPSSPQHRASLDDNATHNVLITERGGLVQPFRGLTYRNTTRREGQLLYKGCNRFIPFDWDQSIHELRCLEHALRSFDDGETLYLRRTLESYTLDQSTTNTGTGEEPLQEATDSEEERSKTASLQSDDDEEEMDPERRADMLNNAVLLLPSDPCLEETEEQNEDEPTSPEGPSAGPGSPRSTKTGVVPGSPAATTGIGRFFQKQNNGPQLSFNAAIGVSRLLTKQIAKRGEESDDDEGVLGEPLVEVPSNYPNLKKYACTLLPRNYVEARRGERQIAKQIRHTVNMHIAETHEKAAKHAKVPLPPELRKDLRAMREDYNAETPEAVPIEVKKEEAGSQSFGWDGQVASQSPFMEVDPRGHMHRPSKSRTFVNLVDGEGIVKNRERSGFPRLRRALQKRSTKDATAEGTCFAGFVEIDPEDTRPALLSSKKLLRVQQMLSAKTARQQHYLQRFPRAAKVQENVRKCLLLTSAMKRPPPDTVSEDSLNGCDTPPWRKPSTPLRNTAHAPQRTVWFLTDEEERSHYVYPKSPVAVRTEEYCRLPVEAKKAGEGGEEGEEGEEEVVDAKVLPALHPVPPLEERPVPVLVAPSAPHVRPGMKYRARLVGQNEIYSKKQGRVPLCR